MTTSYMRRSFLASVTSALLLSAAAVQATTITVTNGNDSGTGSLRQAILDALSGDTINFAAGITTINLTSGELLINKNLTINGPGANLLTVQRSAVMPFRIFDIASSTATISGLTIANGTAQIAGAGVYCVGGAIRNCVITNNQAVGDAPQGGGVYCDGGTVSHCVISGNSVTSTNSYLYGAFAEGGGIYAVGQSQIDHSTVTNNTLTGYYANGAGINANNGSVQNCTISGNTAFGHWFANGGGVYMTANVDGFVRNCLISGNNAHTDRGPYSANTASGGGVYFNGGGTLQSSTLSGNSIDGDASYGGGLCYGSLTQNTIIYGNTATARLGANGPNYYGPATFDHCDSTPLPPGTGNIASDPGFASGYHLGSGSPCIDTGTNQAWMTTGTDLDGNRRIANGTVDMGAFEFGSVPPTPTPTPTATPTATPAVVLYDQLNNPGSSSASSQEFPDFPTHTDFTADDFVVPSGQTWNVMEVDAQGIYFNGPGPADNFNVFFYQNNGSLPGTQVYSATAQSYVNNAGVFQVTLAVSAVLTPGTYWVSMQAHMSFSPHGQWGWADRMVQANSPAAWQNPGGGFGVCQTWGVRGTCVGEASAPDQMFRLMGTIGTPPAANRFDFNGDGHPDYVLYYASTGAMAIWYMNNNIYLGGAFAPGLPAGWLVIDVADFNGDGHPDYAFFNPSTLNTAIWYLNNNVFVSGAYGPGLPSGWALVAVEDFNGDGHPDYVLYNASTGQTAIWYLNNNVYLSGAYGPTLPVGWQVAGVADFNLDGHPDYLLYNASTRQSAIWYLNNNVFVSGAYGPTIASGWQLRGAADFNGDGKPDYALFNPSTLQTAIWYLNNNVLVSGAYGPTLPAGWSLLAP